MRTIALVFCAVALLPGFASGQDRDERIADLERKLAEARNSVAALQTTVEVLSTELQALKTPTSSASMLPAAPVPDLPGSNVEESYRTQILRPDLGQDERGAKLSGQPELFVQSRFQALPIAAGTQETAPSNFKITRMETRWSGRVSDKVGMGFEIQYHPAPEGAAVELVNDAFIEYYATDAITIRTGQFVKPFGFDIQQSSSLRESPERGMFAGYFFPGQRDRGLMVSAALDGLGNMWHGSQMFAAVLNGNRFFADNNRQLNYNLRFRKVFSTIPLAIGLSAQLGRQLLPDGVKGNNRENLYGADAQWAWRRVGLRAEIVAGNMPSTLLSLTPDFAPRFRPGAHSAGGALFSSFRITPSDQFYARYDQFNNDPVSAQNVRAFNIGYLRHIGEKSRFGIGYQFKNKASFNDDLLNTKLQIIWNVVY